MSRTEGETLSVESTLQHEELVGAVGAVNRSKFLKNITQLNVVPGGSFVVSSNLIAADARMIDAEGTPVTPTIPGLWSSYALSVLRMEARQSISSRVAQLVVVNDSVIQKLYHTIKKDSEGSQTAEGLSSLPWEPASRKMGSSHPLTAKDQQQEQLSVAVASGYAGLFSGATVLEPSQWLFEPWFESATVPGLIEMTGAMPGPVGAVCPVGPGVGVYNIEICQDDKGAIWACRIVFIDPKLLEESADFFQRANYS